MHKYNSHGATDVSGYGPVGELQKIIAIQKNDVDFVIHTLPVIKEALKVNDEIGGSVRTGFGAETSGGLLVILPARNAEVFITFFST